MQSIIDRIVENLKKELAEFFSEIPSIEAVEEFSWTKLKRVAVTLTEAYAREIDNALYEDRSGRRAAGLAVERRGNRRTILTDIGEISYERTYYAQRDGLSADKRQDLAEADRRSEGRFLFERKQDRYGGKDLTADRYECCAALQGK